MDIINRTFQLSVIPSTAACQGPLSMEFSRQEYWSGSPSPSPGDLCNPGNLHCRHILYHLSHQGNPVQFSIPLQLAADTVDRDTWSEPCWELKLDRHPKHGYSSKEQAQAIEGSRHSSSVWNVLSLGGKGIDKTIHVLRRLTHVLQN